MSEPWLTIIGIGDGGPAGLTQTQQRILDNSERIIAPERIISRLDLTGKNVEPWSGALHQKLAELLERRGERVTILATGDPMHYGIGATLARSLPIEEMRILPAPSAFSLAAARLGWPLQETACISLHGRKTERLRAVLAPGARILTLTSNGRAVTDIARLLCTDGFGKSRMTVLEHMDGADERQFSETAETIAALGGNGSDPGFFADFNTVGIHCLNDEGQTAFGCIPGLPDDAFRHDGQITKQEIRAVTLAFLRPLPGGLLWDIGAGCGSVSIEWMRSAKDCRAVAIERDEKRGELITLNAAALGVPDIEVVTGQAPEAFQGRERPDAIFCGGGITTPDLFEKAWEALRPQGRLVANVVTTEGEARLLSLHARIGGTLCRLSVARAAPVGTLTGWRPMMPVTIWQVQR